jgi:superfamily II DNA or RNA helicase
MQPKPIVEYPPTAPVWLERWPTERAIRELFAEGIRRMAYRFLGIERRRRLSWTADRLVLEIGNQQATWRWDGKQWRRSCSCGYTNDCCAHAYAAACVLLEVLRHEQWTAGSVPAPAPIPAAPPPPALAEAVFGQEPPGLAEVATRAPATGPQQPAQLEVEADFHHEPGMVILRFYRRIEGRRELLRLQTLNNLAVQARFGGASTRWPLADWSFLKWLAPQLPRRSEVRTNLQVLKLLKGEFDHWLERWEDSAGRFIERSSQQGVSRRGLQPAHLVIELGDEGEWMRIGAVLVLPSGARQPFHAVFQRLAAGGEESVVSGEILKFRPPLSWDLLTRVFSRKDPRMRREHLCEHLPDLLEGRLDLVEGTAVRREPVQDRALLIEATPDGSDVLLRATVAGAPVTGEGAVAAGIRSDGTGFVIEVCDTATIRDLCTAYQTLGATPAGGGRMRVPGVPQKMEMLRQVWTQLPAAVARRVHPALRALLEGDRDVLARVALREERNFVDLSVRWECGGVQVSDTEMREALRLGRGTLRTREGNWLALDPAQAQAAAQRLEAQGLSALEPVRLLRHDAKERLTRLGQGAGALPWTPACRHLGERIMTEADPIPLRRPPALATVLRPYQETGFEFLADRSAHGVGAILADDMGLGKTLQVLALLESWVRRGREEGERFRTLVVCPASVVAVWLEQAARFCPFLNCQAAVGPAESRAASLAREDWDVLVTHYTLLRLDAESLTARTWDMVVLDEAQNIKNPDAQVTRIAKALRTAHTLALTGTPLENRLLDLWSVLDFLNPGLLGPAADFAARYGGPTQLRDLAARIAPLLLRRTKDAVAPELPPRSEEVLHVEMTPGQRQVYDRELLRARETLSTHGPFDMLAALTRLRQVCCDPALLAGAAGEEAGSAKLETLVEMLVELAEEGHFSLVFSQFTSMLERIRVALERAGLPYLVITGDTPTAKRADLVREFSNATTPTVFLLSLRAAGTGLTLTRADYVFIFDPWWNPAVERQAIDRTHRIGQEKPVFAYRLVATNSVEEKVLKLQQEKAELFAAVMGDAEQEGPLSRLTAEDMRQLLS